MGILVTMTYYFASKVSGSFCLLPSCATGPETGCRELLASQGCEDQKSVLRSWILGCPSDSAWSERDCKVFWEEVIKGSRAFSFQSMGFMTSGVSRYFWQLRHEVLASFKGNRGRSKSTINWRTGLQILCRIGIAVVHGIECTVLSFFSLHETSVMNRHVLKILHLLQ